MLLERRAFRNLERRRFERLKKRLRALVGRAARMKPQGHLALAEQVGQSLAEAHSPRRSVRPQARHLERPLAAGSKT